VDLKNAWNKQRSDQEGGAGVVRKIYRILESENIMFQARVEMEMVTLKKSSKYCFELSKT